MDALPFVKMHGLGNDFVVLDAREAPVSLGRDQVRAIAARRTGIGCDQLITLEPSAKADMFMRIHNADGGEVAACGNATRCVATVVMDERHRDEAVIETNAGLLRCRRAGGGLITVDMGAPRLDWQDIPLAEERDTLHLGIHAGAAAAPVLEDPVGVNIGNPHAVFFVGDAEAIDLATVGPALEHHPLFPERANISAAQVRPDHSIRLRVWERGVGITKACGTAACATIVAAVRRQLIPGRSAPIELDGGVLEMAWTEDNHVTMTGPVATSFSGLIDPSLLNGTGGA